MAAAATQAQLPSRKPTRWDREIPVKCGAGRNPRLIPKRGQVLKNVFRVMFSACLPCLRPGPDSRKSSVIFPSSRC